MSKVWGGMARAGSGEQELESLAGRFYSLRNDALKTAWGWGWGVGYLGHPGEGGQHSACA